MPVQSFFLYKFNPTEPDYTKSNHILPNVTPPNLTVPYQTQPHSTKPNQTPLHLLPPHQPHLSSISLRLPGRRDLTGPSTQVKQETKGVEQQHLERGI